MAKKPQSTNYYAVIEEIRDNEYIAPIIKTTAIDEIRKMAANGSCSFQYLSKDFSSLFEFRQSTLGAMFWLELEILINKKRYERKE